MPKHADFACRATAVFAFAHAAKVTLVTFKGPQFGLRLGHFRGD
jgi:hypothetical protein